MKDAPATLTVSPADSDSVAEEKMAKRRRIIAAVKLVKSQVGIHPQRLLKMRLKLEERYQGAEKNKTPFETILDWPDPDQN
ncbi:hypothetical protein A2188_01685 [Candidatus Woesebacteria bacterium RIFOXYA1_FULL_43_9]|uniref:Uncharacterized protein n=1 Tax=Candidatus Woesebacteria bacterium RIFOXYA1_FULL_43_9 TaxID=1802534 RepID=A0A1F8CRE8_9BACT|nr:MAG: hypothetical protein A2188_01685 [Candidatus Woesebacteria bacterium RIFOXYA1_FULL_43_9]